MVLAAMKSEEDVEDDAWQALADVVFLRIFELAGERATDIRLTSLKIVGGSRNEKDNNTSESVDEIDFCRRL